MISVLVFHVGTIFFCNLFKKHSGICSFTIAAPLFDKKLNYFLPCFACTFRCAISAGIEYAMMKTAGVRNAERYAQVDTQSNHRRELCKHVALMLFLVTFFILVSASACPCFLSCFWPPVSSSTCSAEWLVTSM